MNGTVVNWSSTVPYHFLADADNGARFCPDFLTC